MFGLLNIDKPRGVTSRDVVDRVARLVKPHKVGHAGTLDPLATGVLVLCVGRATRLVPYIQEQPKEYRAAFRFGCTSDTDDIEGDVRELADAPEVSREGVQTAIPDFVGKIQQVPPRFSAVKIKGRRAYELARRGKEPELAARTVHVDRIDVVAFEYSMLTLDIECGSGTYVRAIGRDLGRAVGSGAIMTELRRERIGVFRAENALSGNELDRESIERGLLPPAMALAGRPCWTISDADALPLTQGRDLPICKARIHAAHPPADGSLSAVVNQNGVLVAVVKRVQDRLVPRQVFA